MSSSLQYYRHLSTCVVLLPSCACGGLSLFLQVVATPIATKLAASGTSRNQVILPLNKFS